VLGPSLGTSRLLWSRAEGLLKRHFNLLLWDLPGHGSSAPCVDSFSVADLATAVKLLVDELDPKSCCYAGVSLGGGVGQQLALDYPQRFQAMAIICSSARFGTEESWLSRATQVRAQGTSSLIAASSQRWFAPQSLERDPDIVGRLLHTLADTDDESYALCCEALAVFDIRDRLKEITVPLLAIAGELDPSTPPSSLEQIAQGVKHGSLQIVQGSSHLAVAEQPEIIAEAMVTFFQSFE
ncbi:MAG: alpha/beta fold hydrolase, partial [Microbacteriaceae bacterium]